MPKRPGAKTSVILYLQNNNNDKNNNLSKYVSLVCPNFNLFFVFAKEKKGKIIALCQEDCKQGNCQLFNQILSWKLRESVNSCTFKLFCFFLSLKYSPKSVLNRIKTMTA